MTGAGNDFVVIDDRKKKIKNPSKVARLLCDRKWGIGADGLIILRNHPDANFEMFYYNADGSYGGMCGNGGRCISFFAIVNKIAPKEHSFYSVNYKYTAKLSGKNQITLTMKNPSNIHLNQQIRLPEYPDPITYHFIDTGSPHVVIESEQFRNHLDEINVVKIGRYIRFHSQFQPNGTNVNFIAKTDNSIAIRTYERGVEDETLACGTGSIASAIVSHLLWNYKQPVTIIPKSNQQLKVSFRNENNIIKNVKLTGPADIVFTGVIDLMI